MNNRFGKLLQSFLTEYLIVECNDSQNTKSSYSTTFYLFVMFMKDIYKIKPNNIEIEKIQKAHVLAFLNWLETERKVAIPTRNQRLAGIKSFFRFVQINEPDLFETCSQILSIKNKRVPKTIITYFSENEIKIMINHLNEVQDLKKLTMICVLYETGARISEFINIKLSDLNLSGNASITLYGKGNKARSVPISQELVKLINKYLKELYINYGDDYLFYSNYKKRYARSSINKMIDKLIEKLNSKYPNYFKEKFHPHSYRHSKATHLYNNDTPLLYIKDFLGHSTIVSTEIYATPDSEKKRQQILKNAEQITTKNKYSKSKKESLDTWLKSNMK